MKEETSEVLYQQAHKTFERTLQILKEDKVMVLPCDTIYGLCAKMGPAEQKIRELKKRDEGKPFLVLATIEQAKQLCDVPKIISDAWPAPLTAILNSKNGGTIAIRVPSDPFLQAIMESLGSPIYSTSVNESGYQSLTNIMDIILTYKDRVPAFVVDSNLQGTIPSTLIDVTSTPYNIIREGKYDASGLVEKSKSL
ncbi:MAG: L-threonylcarbamoyladenylate synthase [Spirochaetaceae bacterium]|nr:L-threonylcarbamoyladenylate synthase [Spirochaetaceae bacterium]